MASSALRGKLEGEVEINASPEQFYDMLANKPYHVHRACYDRIQGCDLHEGEWGKVGSIFSWHYMQDGKAKVAKEIIEAIDPDKNLITFRVIDGDKLKEYRRFVATVQVSPKSGDNSNVVHWTLDYERLHDGIEHPQNLLQFARDVSKGIDAYLTQTN